MDHDPAYTTLLCTALGNPNFPMSAFRVCLEHTGQGKVHFEALPEGVQSGSLEEECANLIQQKVNSGKPLTAMVNNTKPHAAMVNGNKVRLKYDLIIRA